MRPETRSLIEVNLAVLIFGAGPLFAKLIQLPATLIIFGRAGITVFFLLCFLIITGKSIKLKKRKDYPALMLTGLIMGAHWVTLFYAIKLSNVAISIIAMFTYPIFSAFIEPFFFKEKFHFIDAVFAMAAFTGILIMTPELSASNNISQGIFFGLISAILLAIRNIISRKYAKKYSGSIIMLYQMLSASLLLSPAVFLMEFSIKASDLLNLLFLGFFVTAIGHTLYMRSLKHLKAKTSGIISYWQILFSSYLAFIILQEVPDIKTIIGGTLIVTIVILETLKSK
ncbi:MAG: DMT family transporter [bacterium]|nr:DMT family transporter [bacterium]